MDCAARNGSSCSIDPGRDMANPDSALSIDEYLRVRLMQVEVAIPVVEGIEMYGISILAGTVGGDIFEYINFQQRYDIDARIQRALALSEEYLKPVEEGTPPNNSVDDHVNWLKSRPDYRPEMESAYREARSSEQMRVAEDLRELYSTARSEEHTSELQSRRDLVCRLLLEKKKKKKQR